MIATQEFVVPRSIPIMRPMNLYSTVLAPLAATPVVVGYP
jgi:hypothetical protein